MTQHLYLWRALWRGVARRWTVAPQIGPPIRGGAKKFVARPTVLRRFVAHSWRTGPQPIGPIVQRILERCQATKDRTHAA